MAFTKIIFSTIKEFLAIMRTGKLNFILFTSDEHLRLADGIVLEEDEAGYYVNVQELNRECFDRLMRNSLVERRARPEQGEVMPVPHIRSFIWGVGFVDAYFENGECDIKRFLERSRAEKKLWDKLRH